MWEHGDDDHQWGAWYPFDGDIYPDAEGNYYRYFRECNIMGCTAKQLVETVVPDGKMKFVPSKPIDIPTLLKK